MLLAVNYKTLISFIALQVFAVPVAFLVSGPEKVKRSDGSSITLPNQTSTREQFRLLWRTVSSKKVGLLLPIFFVRPSPLSSRGRALTLLSCAQASWLYVVALLLLLDTRCCAYFADLCTSLAATGASPRRT